MSRTIQEWRGRTLPDPDMPGFWAYELDGRIDRGFRSEKAAQIILWQQQGLRMEVVDG